MERPAQIAGEGRGGGGGARGDGRGRGRGGGGRGGPVQGALPPVQDCTMCNGRHRSNQRCWNPCTWCGTVHHRAASCNGPGPQPHLPPATLPGALFRPEMAYHVGRGMASQMAGGAGFDLSSIMAAADSLSPSLPGVAPSLSLAALSHPSGSTSQRGSFAPEAAEAQGDNPVGNWPAGVHAPAKAGGSRTHRGSRGKRKRPTAFEEDTVWNEVATKVKQEEEEGGTPPLKKIRAEVGEEAAAAGDDQEIKNRHERRSALAIENAALRQLLQYIPEDVLERARQAQEADASSTAAYAAAKQAR